MAGKAQVFLSYAHKDVQFVDNIYRNLRQAGYETWIDHKDIEPGEEWLPTIQRAIKDATFFLACMSPNSLDRRGILQVEIRRALEQAEKLLKNDVFIIPAWIGRGEIPQDDMPEELSKYQWVVLSRPDGMPRLLRSMDKQLRRLGLAGGTGGRWYGGRDESPDAPRFPADEAVNDLKDSIAEGDREAVAASIEELTTFLHWTDEVFPKRHAVRALRYLRQKSWRKQSALLSEALLQSHLHSNQHAPEVRRYYAETLVDQGNLVAAHEILKTLQADTAGDPTESAHVHALRGRALSQIYLQAEIKSGERIKNCLQDAVNAYLEVYKADRKRHLVHGARAAALICRSVREMTEWSGVPCKELGRDVLNAIRDKEEFEGPLTLRDCCAAVEASLAVEDNEAAATWVQRCVEHSTDDATELNILYRNLIDVWELDTSDGNDALFLPLQQKLRLNVTKDLESSESALEAGAPVMQGVDFERVGVFEASYRSLAWYQAGLKRAGSVARVEDRSQRPIATGMLIRGGDLNPQLGDEIMLLTVAVAFATEEVRANLTFQTIAANEASISLHMQRDGGEPRRYDVKEALWSSSVEELDATLARLSEPVEDVSPLPIAKDLPLADGQQRVYIIGHPLGGELAISLHDNLLLDHEPPKLHYRAATEPGSSGSPVFNDQFQVIGMHHAGGLNMPRLHGRPGTYPANEGIWIQSIIDALSEVDFGQT